MQVTHIGRMLGPMHGGNIGCLHGAVLEYKAVATRIDPSCVGLAQHGGTIAA